MTDKNIFFVLDGIDGCGKSTQTRMLNEALTQKGFDIYQARDPGGTAISEKVREIILDKNNEEMTPNTELFLYSSARVQLIEEVLRPKANDGKLILSDRFITSTIAYQAYGGQLAVDYVRSVVDQSLNGFYPSFTFILDVPLEIAAKRMDRELDRMELKDQEFKHRVRDGFLKEAEELENCMVIDGMQDVGVIHDQILKKVMNVIS